MQLTFEQRFAKDRSRQQVYWLDPDGNVLDQLRDALAAPQLAVHSGPAVSRPALRVIGSRLNYDRKQAALHLSISLRSIDYYLARKVLSTVRAGRKQLIPHCELVRFARENGLYERC